MAGVTLGTATPGRGASSVHFPYDALILGTRRAPILQSHAVGRLILLALLVAAPAARVGLPTASAGDGALSVADGRGEITLGARGTGMAAASSAGSTAAASSIIDLYAEDANVPLVWGDDEPQARLPRGGVQCVRRRRALPADRRRSSASSVKGRGIDLSAVGRGEGTIVERHDAPAAGRLLARRRRLSLADEPVQPLPAS